MRDTVAAVRPDLLGAAIDLVGEDPFARVEESTRFAQPAIFCASLAGWSQIRDRVDPIALAGHSLGELSALAAAGALDEHDALRLVVLRGLLMDVAGAASGGGTMLAVLGATPPARSSCPARPTRCRRPARTPAAPACAPWRSTSAARFTRRRCGAPSPPFARRSQPSSCDAPISPSSPARRHSHSATRARNSPTRSSPPCAGERRWSRWLQLARPLL
jgi:hypothetical protein